MAFDQQGIWIRRQWVEFKSFLLEKKLDYQARMTHLEVERVRLRRYVQKLQWVDDLLGGTSIRGNPGASDEAGLPTVCGGDLRWKDDFVTVNLVHRSPDFSWDADIATFVDSLKFRFVSKIRRSRELNEHKLKKALDLIDQYRIEIQHLQGLCQDKGGIDQIIEYIEREFSAKAEILDQKSLQEAQKLVGSANLKDTREVPFIRKRKNLFEDTETSQTREWPRPTEELLESVLSHLDIPDEQVKELITTNPFSKSNLQKRAAEQT